MKILITGAGGSIGSDLVHFFSKKHKKPIILDPKSTNFDKYEGVTIITPNIKELEEVVKKKLINDKEIIDASKKLISKFNFSHLLVTMGKLGMILVSKKKIM